ncbi:putative acetyltransferase [Streptomyces sp. YIM 130001]|uniref:GNAT family N-acetyltransferase n=1 Tax=Streptomyces sp. YIM 130001 TaxID=2259644 RepID=UPI000E657955|nr:GNAT family N-acetyltransferase [Streptomyces sp. YIM 130001]RII16067.1 putative acetyltransferase [Streptomyces sp. YIM 130001]
MDITIRRANQAEFEALGEITAGAYLHDELIDGEDPYLTSLRAVADRAADGEVLVAVDTAGTLLGSVTFAAYGTRHAEISRPGEAEFRALAVAHTARGRGAGEALVRACVERAKASGCHAIVLSTQPTMRSAHRIYERLGFVRTPERDWTPVPGIDLIAYRLAL